MRTSLGLTLTLASLVALAAPVRVRAEDLASYDTEGDADVAGADSRVAALDEAFARAVTLALAELVTPEVRAASRAVLDKELTGRARIWVAKFTVTKDVTADERRQLVVTVRVDRDKLRARLAELAVPMMSAAEASKGRSVTVLLRVDEPAGVRATYGAAAEKDVPGLGALAGTLRGGGMSIKRAPAVGPEARATGALPLADDEAEGLAAEAKADLAAIAGASVGSPVPLRGQPGVGVLVTARVRLLERRGRTVIGDGTATFAARGSEASVVHRAIEQALVAAAADVLPAKAQAIAQAPGWHGDDTPVGDAGVVLVRLAPRTPWGLVLAEQKYLAGTKGVQRATLRRSSPGGWVIGVTTTESIDWIAQVAKKAPAAGVASRVRVQGEVIEVALTGTP